MVSVLPLTKIIASRRASASSRKRFIRQSSRFSGSTTWAPDIVRAIKLIRAAEHQRPDKPLPRPPIAYELCGQRIEQLWMRGPLTWQTEIIDGAHQPLAKQFLPNAIYRHASGQWVFAVGHPVCQLLAGHSGPAGMSGGAVEATLRNPRGTSSPNARGFPRTVNCHVASDYQHPERHVRGALSERKTLPCSISFFNFLIKAFFRSRRAVSWSRLVLGKILVFELARPARFGVLVLALAIASTR